MIEIFRKLCSAKVSEIHQLSRDLSLPAEAYHYARVLSAYLSGDQEMLNELYINMSQSLPSTKYSCELKYLTELRWLVRNPKKIDNEKLLTIENIKLTDVLEAEKYFVLGRAYEIIGQDEKNLLMNLKATEIYKSCDCPQKALRSFYNVIASESRITPYKNFVSEYQAVIESSKAIGDFSFAGMALCQMSREYQIIGFTEKALEVVEEGLHLLESEKWTLHYFTGLLQKAHVALELGDIDLANKTLQETKFSSFQEIGAIRYLIECAMDPLKTWRPELESLLFPTWRERLPDLLPDYAENLTASLADTSLAPTRLEGRLLKTLCSGPLSKWEIIERIYPEEHNSELLDNRIKNLVGRIRKKYPGVLEFANGQYFIRTKSKSNLPYFLGVTHE